MKKIIRTLFVLLTSAVVLSSCAFSTLQTANTVPAGQSELLLGGWSLAEADADAGIIIPEIGMRYGLSNNMDIGARLFGLGFMVDLKLALFQNRMSGPSLALIGGAGYSQLGTDVNGNTVSFLAVDFGAIFSIKMGDAIAPYVSLKIRHFGFDSSGSSDFIDNFAGNFVVGTIGVELFPGKSVSLLLEATQFFATVDDATSGNNAGPLLVSGGIKFRL